MKSIALFVFGAVLLAAAGAACLGAGRLEARLADAQQQLATADYDASVGSLQEAEQYAARGRWVPWLGEDARHEIAARQAAILYWKRDYTGVVPAQPEPVAAVDEANVDLQLVVANGAYRLGEARMKDKASAIQALDEAAAGYLTVLKNESWREDAAYNYEYVVRLRDEIAKGRRPPQQQQRREGDGDMGESGAPSPATTSSGFEIYIPLESNERTPAGGEAGKSTPKDRKG